MPRKYVFSLALIPVQEWIEQARRSRDLRAGSVFLSFVMARMLGWLREEHGADILIPTPPPEKNFPVMAKDDFGTALGWPYSVPNRASGWLAAASDEAARDVFGELRRRFIIELWLKQRRRWLGRWKGEGAEEFRLKIQPHLDVYLKATADGSDCPIDLVWAALPAVGSEGQTKKDLERIDDAFGNVKRTRPVPPWRHGHPVGKCNQCGCREAVGPTASFDAWHRWHREIRDLPWIVKGVRIEKGERLCYVCLARRIAGYEGGTEGRGVGFPSTADIAAGSWERKVGGIEGLREPLSRLKALGSRFGDASRIFYTRRRNVLLTYPEAERKKVVEARRAFERAVDTFNQQRRASGEETARPLASSPSSYLALLTFDGDDMGKRVADRPQEIPRRISDFADRALRLFDDFNAAVFYLGGDEGLVMVDAAGALPLARQVRELFREVFAALPELTLSAGLAFFDFARPLDGAIKEAHLAIKQAKRLRGKDALSVRVEAASGTAWEVTPRKWDQDWQQVEKAVEWIRSGVLASGWSHDVARFIRSIPEPSWGNQEVQEAATDEIRRLFRRRLDAEHRRGERADQLWEELTGDGGRSTFDLGSVPELFHLIAFFAREGSGRDPEPEPQPAEARKGAA